MRSSRSAEDVAAEVEKYKDAALRARADMDNYRKRVAREKEDAIRYANNSLLESLLPILDNFELGLDAAKNTPERGGNHSRAANGAQAAGGLSSRSRRRDRECGGNHFDPNLHDAVAHEPSPDVAEGR